MHFIPSAHRRDSPREAVPTDAAPQEHGGLLLLRPGMPYGIASTMGLASVLDSASRAWWRELEGSIGHQRDGEDLLDGCDR